MCLHIYIYIYECTEICCKTLPLVYHQEGVDRALVDLQGAASYAGTTAKHPLSKRRSVILFAATLHKMYLVYRCIDI